MEVYFQWYTLYVVIVRRCSSTVFVIWGGKNFPTPVPATNFLFERLIDVVSLKGG